MNTIGERLAHIRKKTLNMSQKAFSQLIGISQGALSDAENNNRGLSMEAIIELIKYSKLDNKFTIEWILTGDSIANEQENLNELEKELLKTYNSLDKRGQHKVHTVIYDELDRIKSEKKELSKEKFQSETTLGNSVSEMARNNSLVRK